MRYYCTVVRCMSQTGEKGRYTSSFQHNTFLPQRSSSDLSYPQAKSCIWVCNPRIGLRSQVFLRRVVQIGRVKRSAIDDHRLTRAGSDKIFPRGLPEYLTD